MPKPYHYPEILDSLAQQIAEALEADAIPKARAAEMAHKVAERVRATWGGQLVYISKGHLFNVNQRDRELLSKFNGTNHEQLGREYGLSFVHVYRIVKTMLDRERAQRQQNLFNQEGKDKDHA